MSTPIVLVPLPHDALARRAAAWWNGARGAPEEGAEHLTVGARDGSTRADVRVDRAGRFWRGDAPLSPPTSQPPEPLAALAPLIVHVLRGPGAPDDDAWFDALVAPADDVGEPGPDLTIRVYEVTDGPMPDALSRALAAPVDASDDDWRLDAGRSLVLLAKVGSPAWLGEIRDRVGHDRVITLAGRDLARAGRDAALRHV
ncbi:MAG TPA: hypothetical protein PKA64_05080, partial [Myxococcota bacterium]|nr:hypothetical protein [Myxococcota bacterium]